MGYVPRPSQLHPVPAGAARLLHAQLQLLRQRPRKHHKRKLAAAAHEKTAQKALQNTKPLSILPHERSRAPSTHPQSSTLSQLLDTPAILQQRHSPKSSVPKRLLACTVHCRTATHSASHALSGGCIACNRRPHARPGRRACSSPGHEGPGRSQRRRRKGERMAIGGSCCGGAFNGCGGARYAWAASSGTGHSGLRASGAAEGPHAVGS